MTEEHPNISLMKRLDPRNLAKATDLFSPDVVFHYFNPNLPDMQGDYEGLEGIRSFFERIGEKSGGTFKVEPVSTDAVGDELVVAHSKNTLTLEDRQGSLVQSQPRPPFLLRFCRRSRGWTDACPD